MGNTRAMTSMVVSAPVLGGLGVEPHGAAEVVLDAPQPLAARGRVVAIEVQRAAGVHQLGRMHQRVAHARPACRRGRFRRAGRPPARACGTRRPGRPRRRRSCGSSSASLGTAPMRGRGEQPRTRRRRGPSSRPRPSSGQLTRLRSRRAEHDLEVAAVRAVASTVSSRSSSSSRALAGELRSRRSATAICRVSSTRSLAIGPKPPRVGDLHGRCGRRPAAHPHARSGARRRARTARSRRCRSSGCRRRGAPSARAGAPEQLAQLVEVELLQQRAQPAVRSSACGSRATSSSSR